MKLDKSIIVFDRGELISTANWKSIHDICSTGVRKVENPPGSGAFTIRDKRKKVGADGKPSDQWERNGVTKIKDSFFEHLAESGWKLEKPVGLKSYFNGKNEQTADAILTQYPTLAPFVDPPSSTPGEFDAFVTTATGDRVVIEWETGNVSSSHRSLNKMCLCMIAGLIDYGILVIPNRDLYNCLTDRVGNFEELAPYLFFWNEISQLVERGLLAIIVVGYDKLIDKDDETFPYLESKKQGRSAEGALKIKKVRPARRTR